MTFFEVHTPKCEVYAILYFWRLPKVSEIPLGSLTHDTNKESRVMCNGEPFYDPSGKKHPHAVVRAMYHISYMIRSEFIRSNHIPMVFDDNSCSIEEYERQTNCFNPISGINHLILRDDGEGDACPMIPTRRKLVRGQILRKMKTSAFISHENKIYLEIRNKEERCDCQETYATNHEGIFIRKINEVCHPLPMDVVPHPTTIILEFHENTKVNSFYHIIKPET